jgi:hypothetical protein
VTTYTPYPKVIFAGATEYADETISSISISLGRRDIFEQAQPGLINVELWTPSDTPLTINLGDSVNVQIQDSNGDYQQIAGGIVSDIDISLAAYGEVGSIAAYRITAVGALATLQKRLAGSLGYAKQYDGDRIYDILYEAYVTSWNEVAPTLTWQQVPAITTWENYEGTSQSLIDELATNVVTSGDFELTAYSDGETDALTLAQDAAQSARGFLYESFDNDIHYDAYSTRTSYTPLTLTEDDLLADGLRQAAQWSEIVNDITITYKNNQEKYAADPQSQFTFGQLSGSRTTSLENGSDAQDQADAFLESRAYPRTYPEELSIALHSPTVSDATRDALIGLRVSRPIYTSALPAVFGTTFDGYVEGIKWRLTRYTAEMTLVCSAVSETYPHQIWLQIAPSVTWAGYTPITERWVDL